MKTKRLYEPGSTTTQNRDRQKGNSRRHPLLFISHFPGGATVCGTIGHILNSFSCKRKRGRAKLLCWINGGKLCTSKSRRKEKLNALILFIFAFKTLLNRLFLGVLVLSVVGGLTGLGSIANYFSSSCNIHSVFIKG